MDYKQEMIKRLKEDCKVLIEKKIPKALENISDDKGVNTYRNLTKALADNIKVIEEYEKEEWKPMWNIYPKENTENMINGISNISFDKIDNGTLASKQIKELEDKQQSINDLLKIIIDMLKHEKENELQ